MITRAILLGGIDVTTEDITTSDRFPEGEWVHVAVIHARGVATIYWDGVRKATGPVPTPPPVLRTRNYVGNVGLEALPSQNKDDNAWPMAFEGEMRNVNLAWYAAPAITIDQIRAGPNSGNFELRSKLYDGLFVPMAE